MKKNRRESFKAFREKAIAGFDRNMSELANSKLQQAIRAARLSSASVSK